MLCNREHIQNVLTTALLGGIWAAHVALSARACAMVWFSMPLASPIPYSACITETVDDDGFCVCQLSYRTRIVNHSLQNGGYSCGYAMTYRVVGLPKLAGVA